MITVLISADESDESDESGEDPTSGAPAAESVQYLSGRLI